MKSLSVLFSALAACWLSCPALGEPGVTSDVIVFGQVAAFEGPAGSLGTDMRAGIVSAFEEVNKAGGVKGRRLTLISENDGYEPTRSIAEAKALLTQNKIFAFIGSVGTPTSAAIAPLAAEAGVPFLSPFTGAEFLREPFKPNVVNVRASYFQETETIVEHLEKDSKVSRIAILYQDDAFGRAGSEGVQRALAKRGMSLAGEGSFERNTVAVKSAFLAIERANPEAVILIAPYKPCSEFIKLAGRLKLNSLLVTTSFAGSNALEKELAGQGTGVISTQVVPFPEDSTIPAVRRYQAALKSFAPASKPRFVSLEGYLAGRLTIAALEKLPDEPTRAAFLSTVFANSFDLGGIALVFGPENNQGSARVYLTFLGPDGHFRPITSLPRRPLPVFRTRNRSERIAAEGR